MEKLNGEARSRSFPALASAPRRDFLVKGSALAVSGLMASVQARASGVVWVRNSLFQHEMKKAMEYRRSRLREYDDTRLKLDAGKLDLNIDNDIKTHIYYVAAALKIPLAIASRLWVHESHAGELKQSETNAKGHFQLTSAVFDDMAMERRGFALYKKYFEMIPLRVIGRIPSGEVKNAILALRMENTKPAQYTKALHVLKSNVFDAYANSTIGLVYFASLLGSAGEIPDAKICKQAAETVSAIPSYEINIINRARSVFDAPEVNKKDLTEGLNLEMKYFPESARMFTALMNYNGEPTRKRWYAATIFA